MERWAEHYRELHLRQNIVTETAVEGTNPHHMMKELDVRPSTDELHKAISSLSSGNHQAMMESHLRLLNLGRRTP